MSNPSPSKKTRFKPGNQGGPGRPSNPPELKAIRALTKEYVNEVMQLVLDNDWPALQRLANSTTEPMLKRLSAKALLTADRKGDISTLETILNRVLGKPKETVDHSAEGGFKIIIEDYKK